MVFKITQKLIKLDTNRSLKMYVRSPFEILCYNYKLKVDLNQLTITIITDHSMVWFRKKKSSRIDVFLKKKQTLET